MRLIVVLFLLSLVVVYCINGPLSLRIGSDLDIRRNIVEERQPTGNVDTSLYSRQLFVYGESAQIKLKNAQVVLIGNYSLAYEIGKNLALAGVGNLFVCAAFAGGAASQQHSKPSIIAQHQSLVEYLKELNPGIQVHRLDSDGAQSFQAFFRSHNISTVIAAGADISMLKKLDGSCQAHNVKLVACNTYGVCGFVFNDFLRDFIVSDTTGEAVKEVPLRELSVTDHSESAGSNYTELVAQTIEEESHNLGLGDTVSVAASAVTKDELSQHVGLSWRGEVVKVLDTHRVVLSIPAVPGCEIQQFLHAAAQGRTSMKKTKHSVTVSHQSLYLQALRPSFCASNECAVPKRDAAASNTLWACMKVFEYLKAHANVTHVDLPHCRTMVQTELHLLCDKTKAALSSKAQAAIAEMQRVIVENFFTPEVLRSLQPRDSGGFSSRQRWKEEEEEEEARADIGKVWETKKEEVWNDETREKNRERVLQALKELGKPGELEECPATVSVLGSIAAQEVIKAVTHMYTPISQFLMFESFDSAAPEHISETLETSEARTAATRKVSAATLNRKMPKIGSKILQTAHQKARHNDLESNIGVASSFSGPLSQLYGAEVVRELQNMRVFVVGAGAIGCELLKNFALLGIGSGKGSVRGSGSKQAHTVPGKQPKRGRNRSTKKTSINRSGGKDGEDGSSLWGRAGLRDGGVIVTDMDLIERSNLNRQLLFRESHIGMHKALVAAEQVQHINPAMKGRVHGVTHKLSADTGTGHVFSAAFWRDTDLVVTALDNVDARRYVDEQCLKYGKWLLDSGTQGTKGNTQVVIPHVTESYGSSADPDSEEAIPLCTLKTFPYQPEHCVAWAKSKFEEYFNTDIQLLSQAKAQAQARRTSAGPNGEGIDRDSDGDNDDDACRDKTPRWVDSLSPEQVETLRELARYAPWGTQEALQWAVDTFNKLFDQDMRALLRAHPLNATDEDNNPFWGGSRRPPTPVSYDPFDPQHRAFIHQLAVLRMRVLGTNSTTPTATSNISPGTSPAHATEDVSPNSAVPTNASYRGGGGFQELLTFIHSCNMTARPEEFEKDDATLGHVSVVAELANMRCRVYGISELDLLTVQKVAGNIIPALATTTSLVAGLVTHEVIKVAAERARYRKEQHQKKCRAQKHKKRAEGSKTWSSQLVQQRQRVTHKVQFSLSYMAQWMKRTWAAGRDYWLSSDKQHQQRAPRYGHRTAAGTAASTATAPPVVRPSGRDISKAYLLRHKDRLLKRFRNSFVNLARPMLAFAQPMAASKYDLNGQDLSLWDTIEMPKIITAISLWEVKNILQTKYGVSLQTLSWGDTLLYASFLDGVRGSEEQEDGNEDEEEIELGTNLEELSVAELLEKALRQESLLSPTGGESEVEEGEEEEKEEEEEEREGVELSEETVLSAALRSRLRGQEFILLEATVSVSVSAGDEEGDSATEENQVEEVRIPPLKLYLPFSTETAH